VGSAKMEPNRPGGQRSSPHSPHGQRSSPHPPPGPAGRQAAANAGASVAAGLVGRILVLEVPAVGTAAVPPEARGRAFRQGRRRG